MIPNETQQAQLRNLANLATLDEAADILDTPRRVLETAVWRRRIPSTRRCVGGRRRIIINLVDAETYLSGVPICNQHGTSRELLVSGLSPAQVAEKLGIKLASAKRTAARMGKVKP